MTDLHWGILGTARIAIQEVGPALINAKRSRLAAIGSRSHESAFAMATDLGGPKAFGSYSEVLADPTIDAIYLALPNSLHHEWTLAALAAGKHVLCEKPLGMTADEVGDIRLAAIAANRTVMEAFMWRFHPRIRRVQELIASGAIGTVKSIHARYTVRSNGIDDSEAAKKNIRFHPELGGGALSDLGCYCVDSLRLFAQSKPKSVMSWCSSIPGASVETTASGELCFENSVIGQFYASMEAPGGGHIEILGTAGRIRIGNSFRLTPNLVASIELFSKETTVENFPFHDQYQLEVEHFIAQVLDNEPAVIPLTDSQENAGILDAIRRSWTNGIIQIPAELGSAESQS